MVFQLISRRYERGSTIITSNKTFAEWGQVLGDDVLAAVLLGWPREMLVSGSLLCVPRSSRGPGGRFSSASVDAAPVDVVRGRG
jgi:hypothetical protein